MERTSPVQVAIGAAVLLGAYFYFASLEDGSILLAPKPSLPVNSFGAHLGLSSRHGWVLLVALLLTALAQFAAYLLRTIYRSVIQIPQITLMLGLFMA